MILDSQNLFTALTGDSMPNAATTTSTNLIDMGVGTTGTSTLKRNIGNSNPLYLYMLWTALPVGTSLRIDLRSNNEEDGTTSPTIHWSTGIIPQASYAAAGIAVGKVALIQLPNQSFNPGIQSTGGPYLRYLSLVYVGAGDTSAGKLISGLVLSGDLQTARAGGYDIAALV